MGKTTGYSSGGGKMGGYADPYPTMAPRKRGNFLNNAGSARARMMEEQLKMMELKRKMMMREYQRNSSVKVEPTNVLHSNRGTEEGNKIDDYADAARMADSIRDKAAPGGMGYGTDAHRNLLNMIMAIGPKAAQEGMMQSGRLFAGGRSVSTPTPEENPYSGGGSGELATPGLSSMNIGRGAGNLQTRSIPPGTTIRGGGMTGVSQTAPPGFVGPMQEASGPLYTNYKKGTLPGTVPRTGQTEVHKGEVVIPREQVDSGLMGYLVADAARKRVPLGRGNLKKGYQEGSLKNFEDWYKEVQSYKGKQPSASPLVRQPGLTTFEMNPSMTTPGALGPGYPATQGIHGAGLGGARQRGAPEIQKAYIDWVKSATPAEQRLLPQGRIMQALSSGAPVGAQAGANIMGGGPSPVPPLGESLGRLPTPKGAGAIPLTKEAEKMLNKTAKGKVLLGVLAGSGLVVSGVTSIMGGDYETDDGAPPGLPIVKTIRELMKGKGIGESFGAGAGEAGRQVGSLVKNIALPLVGPEGVAAQFLEGASGGGYGDYFEEGIPAMADEANRANLEGKAKPGQWPPPEIEGQGEPGEMFGGGVPEQGERDAAYGEVRELREQKLAKHESEMARASMKNTMTMLLRQGHSMDPEIKKSLMDQVKFHKTIADGWDKEISRRESAVEDELKAVKVASADYEKRTLLEEQRIAGRQELEGQKIAGRSTLADKKAIQGNLKNIYKVYLEGKPGQQRDAEGAFIRYISNMAKSEGVSITDEQLQEYADAFFGLGPAGIDSGIRQLTEDEF